MAAQRASAERPTLEPALELVARDRSALSSPGVQRLLEAALEALDELVDQWAHVDGIRINLRRIRNNAPHVLGTEPVRPLRVTLAREADLRAAIPARAAEVGLALPIAHRSEEV